MTDLASPHDPADEWVPPHNRPWDVHPVERPEPPRLSEKWALYSRTVQGLIGAVLVWWISRTFDLHLQIGELTILLQPLIDAAFMAFIALAAWGRKTAKGLLYWTPRTRQQRVAALAGFAPA